MSTDRYTACGVRARHWVGALGLVASLGSAAVASAAMADNAHRSRTAQIDLITYQTGVKDVVDQITVDPLSPMDNQIRIDVARAVYGFPSLNRYAIDPAKPIRIAVQNGNVALYGVVDSEADKDAAFIRANGVPGVFSVKNYLQVANQPTESKK